MLLEYGGIKVRYSSFINVKIIGVLFAYFQGQFLFVVCISMTLKRDIKNALFLETYLYNCGHDVSNCSLSKT